MKFTASNGYTADIDIRALKSWRFVKAFRRAMSENESDQIDALEEMMDIVIGEKGKEELSKACTVDGYDDYETVIKTFSEIINQASEAQEVKN